MTSRSSLAFLPLLALLAGAGPAAAAQSRAFVFTTDFSTGGLSAVDLASRAVTRDVTPVGSDAALRWYGSDLYVVNRFGGDNVQVVDGATLHTVRQISTGNGSNPQDICFLSPRRAYVTRYELPTLLILDPSTGATLGTISLAPFADADDIPEMAHLIRVGRYVFVALQRLDRNNGFVPTATSLVAVVDTVTDAVVDCDPNAAGVQAIRLTGTNPVTPFAFDAASGRLLIGCVGAFGVLDGGIEWVNPVTLRSDGWAITESALGGDVGDMVWNGADHSFAIVSDASFNTVLESWSATTGQKLATVYSPGGYSLTDAALNDRGELYVCNSSYTGPGLHVFDAATDAHLAGPLDCGLPPQSVTFDAASAEITPPAPPALSLALAQPRPNPAARSTRLHWSLTRAAEVRVEVFEANGRRRCTLFDGSSPAGPSDLGWDLRDNLGRRLRPGVYLVRATITGETRLQRLVVVP